MLLSCVKKMCKRRSWPANFAWQRRAFYVNIDTLSDLDLVDSAIVGGYQSVRAA